MPAADERKAAHRVALARALLAADGTLKGPSVDLDGLDVTAGDRVIASGDDASTGLVQRTLGTVTAVDPEERAADIDFATWGRLGVGVRDTVARLLRHDYVEPAPTPVHDAGVERPTPELSVLSGLPEDA